MNGLEKTKGESHRKLTPEEKDTSERAEKFPHVDQSLSFAPKVLGDDGKRAGVLRINGKVSQFFEKPAD